MSGGVPCWLVGRPSPLPAVGALREAKQPRATPAQLRLLTRDSTRAGLVSGYDNTTRYGMMGSPMTMMRSDGEKDIYRADWNRCTTTPHMWNGHMEMMSCQVQATVKQYDTELINSYEHHETCKYRGWEADAPSVAPPHVFPRCERGKCRCRKCFFGICGELATRRSPAGWHSRTATQPRPESPPCHWAS